MQVKTGVLARGPNLSRAGPPRPKWARAIEMEEAMAEKSHFGDEGDDKTLITMIWLVGGGFAVLLLLWLFGAI